MAKPAPAPIDVLDFQFKLHCRLKVFENDSHEVFNKPCNLLSVASRYGLLFVGSSNPHFQVIEIQNIQNYSIKEGDVSDYKRRTVTLPSTVKHISVNCDSTRLCVIVEKDGCITALLYDVASFLKQNISVLQEIRLSTTPGVNVSDLCWNPTIPTIFTVCKDDGSLGLYEFSDKGIEIHELPKSTGATCLCWSPKGKQIVVGTSDGKLTQYKPDLTVAKSIKAPTLPGNPYTISLQWISNYQFIAVYKINADDTQFNLVVVDAPKSGEPTFTNYEDVCYSYGSARPNQFFMLQQPTWNVLLVVSSNSTEVGVLGFEKDIWTQWILTDSARAELPLSATKQDTLPVGLALDTSTTQSLPWGENTLPSAPLLLLMSHQGILCCFDTVNLKPGVQQICSAAEPLTDKSGLSTFTTSSGSPYQQLNIPNVVKPTAVSQPSQQQFSGSGLNLTSDVNQSSSFGLNLTTGSAQPPSFPSSLQKPNTMAETSTQSFFNLKPTTGQMGQQLGGISTLFGGSQLQRQLVSQPQLATSQQQQQQLAPTQQQLVPESQHQQVFPQQQQLFGSLSQQQFVRSPQMQQPFGSQPQQQFGSPAQQLIGSQTQPFGSQFQRQLGSHLQHQPTPQPQQQQALQQQGAHTQTASMKPFSYSNLVNPQQQRQELVSSSAGLIGEQQISTKAHKSPATTSSSNVVGRPIIRAVPPATIKMKPIPSEVKTSPSQKTESIVEINEETENMIAQMIKEEFSALDMEVKIILTHGSDIKIDIGSDSEATSIVESTAAMQDFLNEMNEISASQVAEIHTLKQNVLQTWVWFEEARSRFATYNDPTLKSLMLVQPLDAASERRLEEIRHMIYYLESQLVQANGALDEQWENFQDSVKKKCTFNRIPNIEAIYQAMVKQYATLQKQVYILKDISMRIRTKLRKINAPKLLVSLENTTELEEQLKGLHMEPKDLLKVRYERILKRQARMSQSRAEKLKSSFINGSVCHVTVNKPSFNSTMQVSGLGALSPIAPSKRIQPQKIDFVQSTPLPQVTKETTFTKEISSNKAALATTLFKNADEKVLSEFSQSLSGGGDVKTSAFVPMQNIQIVQNVKPPNPSIFSKTQQKPFSFSSATTLSSSIFATTTPDVFSKPSPFFTSVSQSIASTSSTCIATKPITTPSSSVGFGASAPSTTPTTKADQKLSFSNFSFLSSPASGTITSGSVDKSEDKLKGFALPPGLSISVVKKESTGMHAEDGHVKNGLYEPEKPSIFGSFAQVSSPHSADDIYPNQKPSFITTSTAESSAFGASNVTSANISSSFGFGLKTSESTSGSTSTVHPTSSQLNIFNNRVLSANSFGTVEGSQSGNIFGSSVVFGGNALFGQAGGPKSGEETAHKPTLFGQPTTITDSDSLTLKSLLLQSPTDQVTTKPLQGQSDAEEAILNTSMSGQFAASSPIIETTTPKLPIFGQPGVAATASETTAPRSPLFGQPAITLPSLETTTPKPSMLGSSHPSEAISTNSSTFGQPTVISSTAEQTTSKALLFGQATPSLSSEYSSKPSPENIVSRTNLIFGQNVVTSGTATFTEENIAAMRSSTFGQESATFATPSIFEKPKTICSPPIFGQENITSSSLLTFEQPGSISPTSTTSTVFEEVTPSDSPSTVIEQPSTPTSAQFPSTIFGLSNASSSKTKLSPKDGPSAAFGQTTAVSSTSTTSANQPTTITGFDPSETKTPSIFAKAASAFGQTTNASPFSQSSLSASPFGQSNNTFTSNDTSSQPIFGQTASTTAQTFGQAASTAPVFGQTVSTTPSFAQTAVTSSTVFGQTTSTLPAFGSATTSASSVFGQAPSIFGSSRVAATSFGEPATTSSSVFGNSTSSSGSIFGQSPTPTSKVFVQPSAFGSNSIFKNQASSSSPFGSAPASTPFGSASTTPSFDSTSPFGDGTTTSTTPFGSGSVFSTPTTTATPFSSTAFGSTTVSNSTNTGFGLNKSSFGENAFGTKDNALNFGSLNTGAPSTTTTASEFGTGFNGFRSGSQESSAFSGSTIFGPPATTSASSAFGGSSPFSKPTFGGSAAFGSSSFGQQSAFGQTAFGSSTGNAFGSPTQPGPFSGGSQSVIQSGFGSPGGSKPASQTSFGSPASFQKPSGFGSPPAFGAQPSVGFGAPASFGSPTFGGAASFGNSPNPPPVFGGGKPAFVTSAQTQNSTFANLATQPTVGFGNLAQQSSTPTTQSSFSGGSSFSTWR